MLNDLQGPRRTPSAADRYWREKADTPAPFRASLSLLAGVVVLAFVL